MSAAAGRMGIEASGFLRRRGNLRVRRERLRRGLRRWLAALALAVVGVAGGGLLLTRAESLLAESGLLRVRRVTFQDRQHAPAAELEAIVRPVLSEYLFEVDPASLAKRLEEHRWVRAARVRRILPDTLHVILEERRPAAVALLRNRLHLYDGEGTPIEPYAGDPAGGALPLIAGLPAREGASRKAALGRALRLVGDLAERHGEVLARVDRIDVGRPDAIDIVLRDDGRQLRLPPHGGLGMLAAYLRFRETLERSFPQPAQIDLRWHDQIAVLAAARR